MSTSTPPSSSSSCHSLLYLRPEVVELKRILDDFVQNDCIPAEAEYAAHMASRHGSDRWTLAAIPPCLERLKQKAQQLGLWNIFIPPRLVSHIPLNTAPWARPNHFLSVREYGILCESLGRSPFIAPEACNTSAPDTGNMEVLLEFGTPRQQQEYLIPLLEGRIRSTFLMTEPAVASSDATNLQTKLQRVRKNNESSEHANLALNATNNNTPAAEYQLSGHKWWSTGAMDPRCRVALVVARSGDNDAAAAASAAASSERTTGRRHGAHTIVVVPLPHPQVTVLPQPLTLFGYDDAPHGHAQVVLNHVQLTQDNVVGGIGQGFRVAQARLGPGRVHHCMRAIGMASRCYNLLLQRTLERQTFGRYLWQHGGVQNVISDCVTDLTLARLVTLQCAATVDELGNAHPDSRQSIALIKVAVPQLTYAVVDRAVQVHGAQGVKGDEFLARTLVGLRSLRIADGPDAVHQRSIALLAIRDAQAKGLTEKKKKKGLSSRL